MRKLFLVLLVTSAPLYCQVTQEWVSRFNGPTNRIDEPKSMVIDPQGNVYVTGATQVGLYSSDYATLKYNSGGVLQWASYYNGPAVPNNFDIAMAIAVDNFGNVYVTGTSYNNSITNYDYATVKYNSNGVQKWAVRYNGPGSDYDEAVTITVDNLGKVYVTGTSMGLGFIQEWATIKYDTSGNQLWVKRFIGTGDLNANPSAMKLDNSGNIYIAGSSNNPLSNNNYATVKYNPAGVLQWASFYNGTRNAQDNAYAIALDFSGNVYVTGSSGGAGTNLDYATIKYNSSGIQQWVSRYDGPASNTDIAKAIAVDSLGNIFVTGQSTGVSTNYDCATIKYNSNGDTLWIRRYNNESMNGYDGASAIALDKTGNVYVTGFSVSSTLEDYLTLKYSFDGSQLWLQRYNGTGSNSDEAIAVSVDDSGNVYTMGLSTGANNFDYVTIKYLQQQVKILNLTALIEGFYNDINNSMISDTIDIYLRNASSPYSIVDFGKSVLDTNGNGIFNFYNPLNGTPYYIVIKHRNSIETWSAAGNNFNSNQMSYDFTSSSSQAYGNNMKLKGMKWTFFSGDSNQDGIIESGDLTLIDNDVYNFVSGYVPSDITGDGFADASDLQISYNNASNFISVQRP